VTKPSYNLLIPFAFDHFLHPPNIVDLTEIHLLDQAIVIEESGEAKASKTWPSIGHLLLGLIGITFDDHRN
jgi:hypothetical protein